MADLSITEKPCSNCKTIQPLKDFYNDKSTPSGKTSACKLCSFTRAMDRFYKLRRVKPIAASLDGEEWRPITGYEGLYDVSSLGRVRSYHRTGTRGGLVRQYTSRWGYRHVKLIRSGHSHTVHVHRLVGETFIGPLPTGLETRHLDDDKSHNYISNLTYGTKSENAQDRLRNGHHNQVAKTHCPQGHPYDAANTRISVNKDGSSHRFCLTCKRKKARAWRKRQQSQITT